MVNASVYAIKKTIGFVAIWFINLLSAPKSFSGPLLSYNSQIRNEKKVMGKIMITEKNMDTYFMS